MPDIKWVFTPSPRRKQKKQQIISWSLEQISFLDHYVLEILHCQCTSPCTVTCSAVSSEVWARVWRDLVPGAGPVFVYRAADCGPHHPAQNGMGK